MKLTSYIVTGLLLSLFLGCGRNYEVPVPYKFDNTPGSGRFTSSIRRAMEGVYGVTTGSGQFGEQVALKWTYTVNGSDTTHYLSIFTGADAAFFSMEGSSQTDSLVVKGFWRKLVNTENGLSRLTLKVKRNNEMRAYTDDLSLGDTLVLNGTYGEQTADSFQPLTLTYRRPLNKSPFAILAHRGGGRTSDLLPASENSLDIIKLASRLGATGVEIDVRYTKDGVPILYHDNTLNLRLIQKNGLAGPIEDYTYQQLSALVRLINGEKIPTLEEALETVISNTSLDFVWLDTKYIGPMDKMQAIQQKYRQKALLARRNVRIVIGLPTTDALESYEALSDKANTPVLCELDTAITRRLNARIWAPRWTLGPQTEEVKAMKAEGRTVFVWTLDEAEFIRQFVDENSFDGILSNYSPLVAYYHYVRQ